MAYPLVILGGGLSGIAAGIRFARFGQKVLILEKHFLPGGLNSYYYRNGHLLETGLHAMTNFAAPGDKSAPLNRLFRQLKLKRKNFRTKEQIGSEIIFPSQSLFFSNDISILQEQINKRFPQEYEGFQRLLAEIKSHNPFLVTPRLSARKKIGTFLKDNTLVDMLLCPLMLYGNSEEHDMDYSQFVIMFMSVFLEGFFRPADTIKEFLDMLINHYQSMGGEIRYNCEVSSLSTKGDKVSAVCLADGETIECERVISTIGAPATMDICDNCLDYHKEDTIGRMSFVESIYILAKEANLNIKNDRTIIFYNNEKSYNYCRPQKAVNVNSGVICFPHNFKEMPDSKEIQVRVTHPANYSFWAKADQPNSGNKGRTQAYLQMKSEWQQRSLQVVSEIIGNFQKNVVYQDTFTPLTIHKFTGKADGAIYGSPIKIKNGLTNYKNLYLAGTDQGFLGIVGSMLSGITIVNQCVL